MTLDRAIAHWSTQSKNTPGPPMFDDTTGEHTDLDDIPPSPPMSNPERHIRRMQDIDRARRAWLRHWGQRMHYALAVSPTHGQYAR